MLLIAFVLECTPDAVNEPLMQLFPQDEWGFMLPVDIEGILDRYRSAYGSAIATEVGKIIKPRFMSPNRNTKVEVTVVLQQLLDLVHRGEEEKKNGKRKRGTDRQVSKA